MVDLIKRFGHVIAAFVIAYYAYSAIEAGKGGLKDKQRLDRIPQSALPLRGPDEKLTIEGDPFQRDWAPYGPEYSAEAIAERKRLEQEAEDKLIAERKAAHKREREAAAEKLKTAKGKAVAWLPFELRLDSVLALADGGVARVSGRTVRTGEPLKGLDDEAPPVVTRIGSTDVEITYRGETHVLDIRERRSVQISRKRPTKPAPSDAQADAGGGFQAAPVGVVADEQRVADEGSGEADLGDGK